MDRMTRAILFTLVIVGAYGMGLATGMLLGWTGTVEKPAFVRGPIQSNPKVMEQWKADAETTQKQAEEAFRKKADTDAARVLKKVRGD